MKKHHYLVCCEMQFADNEGNAGVTRKSVIIHAPEQRVTVTEFGMAQQMAQIALFNSLNEQVNVLGLTIIGVSYLGEMTEEEFNAGAVTPAND